LQLETLGGGKLRKGVGVIYCSQKEKSREPFVMRGDTGHQFFAKNGDGYLSKGGMESGKNLSFRKAFRGGKQTELAWREIELLQTKGSKKKKKQKEVPRNKLPRKGPPVIDGDLKGQAFKKIRKTKT